MEQAVDPEADDELVAQRLDMDVARAVVDRLGDHEIDEPHHRGVLGLLAQGREIDVLVGVLAGSEVDVLEDLADSLARANLLIEGVDRLAHVGRARQPHIDARAAGERAQMVDRDHVERVSHRHIELIAVARQREHARLPRQMLGNQLHHVGVGPRQPIGRGDGEIELLRQQVDHLAFVEKPEADQGLAEPLARIALRMQRGIQLI